MVHRVHGRRLAALLAAAIPLALAIAPDAALAQETCGPGPVVTATDLRAVFPDALRRPLHFVVGDWPSVLESQIASSGAAMGSLSAWVDAALLEGGGPILRAWAFRLDGTCPADLLPAVAPLFGADTAAATGGTVGGRDVTMVPILGGGETAAVVTFDDVIVLAWGEPSDLDALVAGLRIPGD